MSYMTFVFILSDMTYSHFFRHKYINVVVILNSI